MRILDIKALRGPNYWSGYWNKLIVMRLDLEDFEGRPTDKLENFTARLRELMPSLSSHGCSYKQEGGFLRRVEEGTWAGHVVEHLALELQTLAGMDTGYGRTRETSAPGVYNVVFSYIEEDAGRYVARASVKLFEDLAAGKPLDEIQQALADDVQRLREIREDVRFGPSTGAIVQEAEHRDIPHIRLNAQSLVQLGYGVNQQRIQATVTGRTNMIAVDLASDKDATKKLLGSMGVPVPRGSQIIEEEEIEGTVKRLGFPIAVKPLDANHGKGITVGLHTLEEVRAAFPLAKKYSRRVIVEQSLTGQDFRALVVNNRLIAVAERIPAHVTGDGEHTIRELVDIKNQDPRRGYGHENVLTLINIDAQTEKLLATHGYTQETVPPDGELVRLKTTANISTGGTAIDRTDEVHPFNVSLFERIARIIGLDVAGIDVVAPDLSTPLTENGGGIIEVNAAPGFRMHLAPSDGLARNVAEHVIDMLFPPGTPSRVPVIAVTGTNGKTTTTRLIAHIVKNSGLNVGFTTTEGIYIGNSLIQPGDNTGPVSAQLVLKDPTVEIAVLETARGGIIRAGLGFDRCDIGVVMNVTVDHLGLKDIETIEDMARVKAVVPRAVGRGGHAVLNADDELVFAMREDTPGRVALFSMEEDNPHVVLHTNEGGIACVFENGYVTLLKGKWKVRVEKVINIPLTYGGRAAFMIQNVLAATLAAFLQNISIEDIRSGLTTFVPSVAQTPGRLNLIEMGDFTVLIDFAHNPAGMEALQRFVSKFPNKIKTGVIGGTGDRRDDDLLLYGRIAAQMFTHVIVREDDDLRGRAPGDSTRFVIEGLRSVNPEMPVKEFTDAREAINFALKNARKGELLVILADNVGRSIELVSKFREQRMPVKVVHEDIPNQH
ncbi:MAG TPA: cyanophycin synthetase [Pyrinomonadaceae bacterium]|jgi:cyanophycin synthetase|nr:cyanophycin synthetase [Pyrinomonadaceae bacterium]